MKKIFSYAASLLITISVAAAPGSKLVKSFNETFPNAANIKWYDDKAGYFVSFIQNGNFEKVLYNKDGDFICSWKYSNGKELSTAIVIELNRKIKNCEINGVTEFATEQNVSYEINLADNKNWYLVKASADGKIISQEKYSK